MSTGGEATRFGALLQQHRERAGLSQEELAERAGLSRRGISDLERGVRHSPYPDTVRRLADALGLEGPQRTALLTSLGRGEASTSARIGGVRLPEPLTSFVGRHAEVLRVRELLQTCRLLTLLGVGGVGKTRLALEAARAWTDAAFVDLGPLVDGQLVPAAIASALGLREQPDEPVLEILIRALGSRDVLVVLDNCEHLVEACAELVERLLAACPRLRILATAREPLWVTGEQRFPLPPLAVPGPAEPGYAGFEAVRLFVERVQLVQPDFTLDEQVGPAVAEICRRLDGIPLAIELAAVRVPAYGVQQLAARLDDRFHVLTRGARSAPPRQQTLRGLIDWSYGLLTTPEQVLFRRLAVFAGGWTLQMAEQICAGDGLVREQIVELLPRLVERSLALATNADGETRYHFLETLRQYAAERLRDTAEDASARRRHLEWCVALAEQAAAEFDGPQRATWLRRLEREHGNLRAALGWSLAHPDQREAALRLAGALGFFWWLGGHVQEGSWWLAQALEQPPTAPQDERSALALARARARALAPAAHLRLRQRDLSTARRLLDEARTLARSANSRDAEANVLLYLGQLALEDADPTTARCHFAAGLKLTREDDAGSPPPYVFLLWLGHAAEAAGQSDEAGPLYVEARELARATGDTFFEAVAARGQASVAIEQRTVAAARRLLREAVALSRRIDDTTIAYGTLLAHFARLAAVEGLPERAVRLAGAARALRQEAGTHLHAYDCELLERSLEPARRLLPAETATTAWGEGQTMGLETALAYAETPGGADGGAGTRLRRVPTLVGSDGSTLTAREREIAGLAARGWTNTQIAAELVISSGTAKRHLENILGKLGLASRAQLRDWFVQHEVGRGTNRPSICP